MSVLFAPLLLVAAGGSDAHALTASTPPAAGAAVDAPMLQDAPLQAAQAGSEPGSGAPPSPPASAGEDEIVVSGGKFRHAPGDSFERINATSFAITQKVDDAIVAPIARSFDSAVVDLIASIEKAALTLTCAPEM